MNPENLSMEYVPTFREKLGWKLFPHRHCDIPDVDNMRDCLITITRTSFSFADRIRILISGKVEVQSKTATQNVVGEHFTNAATIVRPPTWLSR